MRDFAFRPRGLLTRMQSTFSDHVVVELPRARHYIQEDAPDEIASAIPTGDRSTMREPVIQGLVGVYHANGSLRGELAYVLGKLIGRSHCALCDITHARLRRRPSFDASVATLPVAFELVHLDERSDEVAAASQGRTPCVLARTDRGMTLLLDADALESCDGGPAELRAAIDRAVTALGLRWP